MPNLSLFPEFFITTNGRMNKILVVFRSKVGPYLIPLTFIRRNSFVNKISKYNTRKTKFKIPLIDLSVNNLLSLTLICRELRGYV